MTPPTASPAMPCRAASAGNARTRSNELRRVTSNTNSAMSAPRQAATGACTPPHRPQSHTCSTRPAHAAFKAQLGNSHS